VRRFIHKIATLVALSAAPAGAEEVSKTLLCGCCYVSPIALNEEEV
jgi:elongation factor Ts